MGRIILRCMELGLIPRARRAGIFFDAPVYPDTMTKQALLGAVAIIIAIVLIWVAWRGPPKVVTGPSGGVAPIVHPAITTPVDAPIVPYTTAATPPLPPLPQLTKYILIEKRWDGPGRQADDIGFQIGEVAVWADGRRLRREEFSDAKYLAGGMEQSPAWNLVDGDPRTYVTMSRSPLQQVILTLEKPTRITMVRVFNRIDCCRERLDGAKVSLLNEVKVPLWTSTLIGTQSMYVVMPGGGPSGPPASRTP